MFNLVQSSLHSAHEHATPHLNIPSLIHPFATKAENVCSFKSHNNCEAAANEHMQFTISLELHTACSHSISAHYLPISLGNHKQLTAQAAPASLCSFTQPLTCLIPPLPSWKHLILRAPVVTHTKYNYYINGTQI